MVTSRTVARAIENLNLLARSLKAVTLVWIPAHKGHVGNERADELAKQGSRKPLSEHGSTFRKPHVALKAKLKRHMYEDWGKEWSGMSTANHARSFYGGPNPGKAKFVYKLARLELGRFVRIITGHNNLNFFQTKIGLFNDPACRFCGRGDETITHLMAVCPKFLPFCLLYTSPSPRDRQKSRMPSSA